MKTIYKIWATLVGKRKFAVGIELLYPFVFQRSFQQMLESGQ